MISKYKPLFTLKDSALALIAAIFAAVLLVPVNHFIEDFYKNINFGFIGEAFGQTITIKISHIVTVVLLFIGLALGVFFTVKRISKNINKNHQVNFQPLMDTDHTDENYHKVKQSFEGKWDYECTVLQDMEFPFPKNSGNAHGGYCKIEVTRDGLSTKVNIHGYRTWIGRRTGDSLTKTDLEEVVEWRDKKGAFISKDEVMYTYGVMEDSVSGITFLTLDCDALGNFNPKGRFYYLPKPSRMDQALDVEVVRANQRSKKYVQISGEVVFSNHRK